MNENYEKLMQYSLSILAKKRYTVSEIIKKLENYIRKLKLEGDQSNFSSVGIPGGKSLRDEVIDRLKELKYLNDEDYVMDYVAQRVKLRPRGEFLLRKELKMKGIDEKLLNSVLAEAEIDEVEMSTRLLEKKMHKWLKYSEFDQKGKAYAFLSSKGFDRDAIYKSIECCYRDGRG